jgi:hypothetical protein
MQERPQVAVAAQHNMGAAATIAAIGPTHSRKLVAPEMLVTRTAMAAAAKHPYLIYKVLFFHAADLREQNNEGSSDKLF